MQGSDHAPPTSITVNHANLYKRGASLVDIFGPNVSPGRELLDEIQRIYKVPAVKNLAWFIGDGEQKAIMRHPLNSRRQDQVLQVYKKSVQQRGIIKGVRGECWVRAPNPENNETVYLALTFGTLTEAFYAAWADADRESYANLKLTHRVEKAWANHRLALGITARTPEYEVRYREFVQSNYPDVWTSFKHFEATRNLYNTLVRYQVLPDVKEMSEKHCQYLHAELAHDSVIYCMKELITACTSFFDAMSFHERKAIIMALTSCCAP
ncbi:unnamed protein product [Symbiodinium sp. CCMP2456]|nr:unnamed protein product [Symbiodinium sp. CCMP2456]